MADDSIVPYSLDDYFQSTPVGSLDRAIGNNLYGINHRQVQTAAPSNKDRYGLTFFTRPQLNMQLDNIRNVRQFSPLTAAANRLSIQQFVRCTLDPRLQAGYAFDTLREQQRVTIQTPRVHCPMVDMKNVFIPILTNNLNSISGWPDITAPTFTSAAGLYNESWAIVDGLTRNYETFDLDATFRNTRGDPIIYLFYIWLHYMSNVFEGKLMPYLDMIAENEIDYNTRIYRLVMDQNNERVTKIAATGAAFPISVSMGSFFDYSHEKPFNDQNKDITIRFKAMGVDYQDDVLMFEFNKAVQYFNPAMHESKILKEMQKVPRSLLVNFNNRGYPRINTTNNELEWYVEDQLYKDRMNAFVSMSIPNNTNPSDPAEPTGYKLDDEESGD